MVANSIKQNFLKWGMLVAVIFANHVMAAVESEPFTLERFEALQNQGAKILVDISASWCPDCRKQQVILGEYQAENPNSGLHVLSVSFDDQKEWVTHFKAPRQSTLILFNGKEQVWFSVAETRKAKIYEALSTQ